MGWFWKRENGRDKTIADLKNLDKDATVVAMSKDGAGFHLSMTEETGVDEAIGMLFMGMQHLAVPRAAADKSDDPKEASK